MKNLVVSLLIFSIMSFVSCVKTIDKEDDSFSGQLTDEEIAGKTLSPEILWKFGRLGEFALSPNGSTIAFTVSRYDVPGNRSVTDIYTMPAGGGDAKKLTISDDHYGNVRWSADGQQLYFLGDDNGDSQIFQMNPDGGGKIRLSNFSEGINGFEISADGNKLLYIKSVKVDSTVSDKYPDLSQANAITAEDLMYRHWNRWNNGHYSHIFISSFSGNDIPEGKDIMEGEPWDAPMSPYFDQAEITWSPDGKFIAYTSKKMKGKDYALSTNSDIYLYELESGITTNITKGMAGYDRYPVFSPKGGYIAWQSMEKPGFEADKDRLFIMDLLTGNMEYITKDLDQDATNLTWAEDESSIFFISGSKATYQIYEYDLQRKAVKQLSTGTHNYTSFAIGNGFLIGSKMSMSMASELFRIDAETGADTQISFINKNIYDNIPFGKVEERWVETTDKKQMLVWVIYPPDFDPAKKYPTLLYCQGGPQSAVSQFFSYRWNFQIMAANGYIIVAPNRRGLPTFGSEWNEQISGDYGGQNIKDYLSAIDALAKEPFVDESRLGAVGASYGGYSVFYLAGHHEGRFKSFIAHCGIFNFESMYASTEEMFFVNHDYEGAYWEKPRPGSYKFSPHLYIDKWDTPIFIITGQKDYRIPYTESLQAFNAAQLRGIESKLLVFPDEGHHVLKPQNGILWQREFFDWLDYTLE
jgi:dipeptidyl aminopeptidase/acylaminoacyl peptidase